MNATHKISNTNNAVIVYRERDFKGRQRLVVRWPTGHKIVTFRRISALVSWLKNGGYNPFVYDELPYRTRKTLDAGRQTVVHSNAKYRNHLTRPRLGNLCPQLGQLRGNVPKYHAG